MSAASFPASLRLHRPEEFRRVFRLGCRVRGQYFTIVAVDNGSDTVRLGLAIARKAAGNSVRRNRLKRLVRETFRIASSELPAFDIVVTAVPAAGAADNKVLWHSLAQHWQNLVTRCESS